MKTSRVAAGILMTAGLSGCGQAGASTALTVRTESADSSQAQTLSGTNEAPIHRVLRGADGKVLFAYDLTLAQSGADGPWHLLLKPAAGGGPTFATARSVDMKGTGEAVRVELLQRPGTGDKVVDVFTLSETAPASEGIHAHLMAMHNHLWKWIHGQ
jgi:hypothetical protein